jgi:benzoyl-CoA reductase subunit C
MEGRMSQIEANPLAALGDPAAPLLARAQAAIEDRKLEAVKAWKAKNPGGLAIGHMPIYTPRPLIEAIGALPVAMFGGGDQVDIIRGDSYFQSYICHIPRSTIELALGGDLDALDGVIFPAICDVIRNLSGMWKLLFPQKWSAYLDVPQNFDRALGGKFYGIELKRLAKELHERGARPLTDDALAQAIADENERRAAIADLDAIRQKEPWRVRASEAYLMVRGGSAMPAKEHTALLRSFLAIAGERKTRAYDNVRVVMIGSFCEQPPIDLLRALEKAGCDIVWDDAQLGMRTIEGPIEIRDGRSPLDALVDAYCERGVATASRYIANDVKGAALIERVKQTGAEGVIFSAASFCDPALLDQPMLEAALDHAGIPHTSFKYAENTAQFQVIREQAGAFSDSVRLFGGGA